MKTYHYRLKHKVDKKVLREAITKEVLKEFDNLVGKPSDGAYPLFVFDEIERQTTNHPEYEFLVKGITVEEKIDPERLAYMERLVEHNPHFDGWVEDEVEGRPY